MSLIVTHVIKVAFTPICKRNEQPMCRFACTSVIFANRCDLPMARIQLPQRHRPRHHLTMVARPMTSAAVAADQTLIPISLVSRYSAIPTADPSLPKPLSLTPPKGAAAEVGLMSLMPTIPNRSFSATRIAREISRV